jgi:dihydroxyacetone kinase-like protein
MTALPNAGAGALMQEVAAAVVENRAWLSELDGQIGDGDHGFNMAKGFGRAAERIGAADTLDSALNTLSEVLIGEIGGSMGPLYGMMFSDMADAVAGAEAIDAQTFGRMLHAGLDGVRAIGSADVGDKTLLDTLVPSVAAYDAALAQGGGFADALTAMTAAAETGRDSTRDMVARIGRASRLGERSRGVLDPGATSCCLILVTLADGVARRLDG